MIALYKYIQKVNTEETEGLLKDNVGSQTNGYNLAMNNVD